MKTPLHLLCTLLLTCPLAAADSLKAAFDEAGPAQGYDRYLELETGVTYTGGLWIGPTFNRVTGWFEGRGEDVRIVGNGAILDLQGGEICMAYCQNRLDLDDCIILNGDVRFRGYRDSALILWPRGSVTYCTLYGPHDYGVRLVGVGANIMVARNIMVDSVDTGPDFQYISGIAHHWMPTGACVGISLQGAGAGFFDNWTYHSDPAANGDPLRHFVVLCDYG